MKSYVPRVVFFACMTVGSLLLSLYVNRNAFIVTAICFGWFVYYLVKWLSGGQPQKSLTSKEVFEEFHGGPKDGTGRPHKES